MNNILYFPETTSHAEPGLSEAISIFLFFSQYFRFSALVLIHKPKLKIFENQINEDIYGAFVKVEKLGKFTYWLITLSKYTHKKKQFGDDENFSKRLL